MFSVNTGISATLIPLFLRVILRAVRYNNRMTTIVHVDMDAFFASLLN